MRTAVNNFQKSLFIILLYVSGFCGMITDFTQSSRTVFFFACDALIIFLSLLSFSFMKGRLALIIMIIVACIIFNISYNGNGLFYSLNGVRDIVIVFAAAVFFNKIFDEGNEELSLEYIEIFKKYATIFLIIQVPVAFYQFFEHGPSDWVGGTFGNKGSGLLTLAVVCLVFFLSHYTQNFSQRILLYLCLIPLLLNETKISFILIPLLVLFIHFQPRFKNIMGALAVAALFLFLFNQYYSHTALNFDNNMEGIFTSDFLDDYLFGDIYMSDDVPRFTKLVVGWQLLAENTHTFLFGFEYGMFKGGSMVELSHFGQSIEWLLSGTRPYLFFLMIQGGLFLVLGIILLFLHINKYFKRDNNKFKTFLFLIFIMVLFYNDALRFENFLIIYLFLVFYANSSLYNRTTAE